MSSVLVLSGSPSKASRSATLADLVVAMMTERVATAEHLRLCTLPGANLLTADDTAPQIAAAVDAVAAAQGSWS